MQINCERVNRNCQNLPILFQARPKHMACISVSSFHLATRQIYQHQKSCGLEDVAAIPDTRDLVAISQCKCTLGDLTRMEGIISSKLDTEPGLLPITPVTFLQLFHALFAAAAERLGVGSLYAKMVAAPSLWLRLEILACDAACANFRASEVALVLLCTQLDSGVADLGTRQDPSTGAEIMRLVNFAMELQKLCKVNCRLVQDMWSVVTSALFYKHLPGRSCTSSL
jgi:cyclin G2